MKKINKKQQENLKIFLQYASFTEVLTTIWWDIFYPKKISSMIENLEKGMHWKVAYKIAKHLK